MPTYTLTQIAASRRDGSCGRRATNIRSTNSTPSRPTSVSPQTNPSTAMVNLRSHVHTTGRPRRGPPMLGGTLAEVSSATGNPMTHGAGSDHRRADRVDDTVTGEYSPPGFRPLSTTRGYSPEQGPRRIGTVP